MPEHRFETPGPIRLEVKVAAGEVDVATVDDTQSTVTLEGGPRIVESINVRLTGDRLLIEERRKGLMGIFSGIGEPLHVTARVPHGSSVDVATASSDLQLDGTFGGLELKSASGDVRLIGELEGDADVKTASGHIRLPRVGGNLSVKTVSGNIAADAVDGSVSVKSVSADLSVGSLHAGEVDVHSVSGDVTLGIAPGSCVDVDAGSASGDLSSEIPLSADAPGDQDGPTVVIRVNTVSGDLRLRRAR